MGVWKGGRQGMRVFVTGATGVVGRRAVPLLVDMGHRVTAVGRSAVRLADLARAGADPLVLDLFDRSAVGRALPGHDVVVNLATHMPSSSLRMFLPGAWRENDRLRRDASALLTAAALEAGVRRFVQESFAPAYADGGDRWLEESWSIRPVRYNRTILDAERSAARFGELGGAALVLRFAAFYGPDAGHVRELIALVRKGWAPLPGPADGFVSSVSHDDAATAVVAALELPPGTYNVADDEPLRRRELVDTLAAALGVSPPRLPPAWVRFPGGSLGELMARSVRVSNRRLRAASSWRPRYPSLREGWRAIVGQLG
jgi:nucleoside-diphosphate-sugar epimerase